MSSPANIYLLFQTIFLVNLGNVKFLLRNVEEGLPSPKWPLILALSHKLLRYRQGTYTCASAGNKVVSHVQQVLVYHI